MVDIWIKNNHIEQKNWCGQGINPGEYYLVDQDVELSRWQNDSPFLTDLAAGIATIAKSNSGSEDIHDFNEALNFLKKLNPTEVSVISSPLSSPFAAPLYRTKNTATPDIVSISESQSNTIDYYLTREMYVSGGSIIIRNAKFGDYITAEIVDKDGLIPEPYRAALCESWPTVAVYILKAWVEVDGGSISTHKIDTKPLNAKITSGLYLRVTYHTTAEAGVRDILINYDLTVKV